MALGRQGDRQGDLVVTWKEMPRSPAARGSGVMQSRRRALAGAAVSERTRRVFPVRRCWVQPYPGYASWIEIVTRRGTSAGVTLWVEPQQPNH
jgi:hypothetical protein